ncbi:hypothetical protein T484DRAFT_1965101, partial [Baffinella frigidus]
MDVDASEHGSGDMGQLLHAAPLPAPTRVTPSFFGSRVWAAADTDIFLACGRRVHRVAVGINRDADPAPTEAPTRDLRSVDASPDWLAEHDAPISSITGLTVARRPKMLVSCDVRGVVNALTPPDEEGSTGRWQATRLPIEDADDGESGWTGAALDFSGTQAAIARGFQRSLTIMDLATAAPVRTFRSMHCPTRVAILGAGGDAAEAGGDRCGTGVDGLVALAEGHQVSLWDARVSGRTACVARVSGSLATLYALGWGKGTLAAGGADRSIYVFEPRKWSICGRAMAIGKAEIMWLGLSHVDPSIYYACGADSQLICGQWEPAGGVPAAMKNSRPNGDVPLSV